MVTVAAGTIAAVVAVGFGVLGRLVYRLERDLTAVRERLARVEGKGED